MVKLFKNGVYALNGSTILEVRNERAEIIAGCETKEGPVDVKKLEWNSARKKTMAYGILSRHNTSGDLENLKIKFDAIASHDITYVSIVQTARAGGMDAFPLPYVLTNCHNSLCAVGGTINEDDHVFGLSAAKKYGGIYVPAHLAVIHQYVREEMTCCGNMILGSDSHTRYGALGVMGVGEGGPELVKQLFEKTYDVSYPEIIAVYLEGSVKPGVGPQDVALAIIGAVFKEGFVKNKVLEFIGPGIRHLSVDFRNGIDVMTTETTCLSSIWETDDQVKAYYERHGRPEGYSQLTPGEVAYYDGLVKVNLDRVEPMIALPFHPSNTYRISELNQNMEDILREVEKNAEHQLGASGITFSLTDKIVDGRLKVDQGIIAGCAGGSFENLVEAASIVDQKSIGSSYFTMSAYPASQPINSALVKNGSVSKLLSAGITVKTAFCGPCFGAGDVPAHGGLSIRHTTRNFMNREGSKPSDGQFASVALMDARSIAATAVNGGFLTPATQMEYEVPEKEYTFNREIYSNRVYKGFGKPDKGEEVKIGPNITDWPKISNLPENLLLKVVTVIDDPVTTTDELIPSGETSSLRSNPLKLAEYTLSRKDPSYVSKAKEVRALEEERQQFLLDTIHTFKPSEALVTLYEQLSSRGIINFSDMAKMLRTTGIGSTLYAIKPGDGSAREQAASCQKILGGWANIAVDYATKRYRSNLINWGILPFTLDDQAGISFQEGDLLFISGIKEKMEQGAENIQAIWAGQKGIQNIELMLKQVSKDERDIILKGCLINYYAAQK